MALRRADLLSRDAQRRRAQSDRTTRVRVYTPDGTLICLAGLGAGEDVMTFPACFEVGMALCTPHWIRHCRPGDERPFLAGRDKRLEDADGAEVQPRSLIHDHGRVA